MTSLRRLRQAHLCIEDSLIYREFQVSYAYRVRPYV